MRPQTRWIRWTAVVALGIGVGACADQVPTAPAMPVPSAPSNAKSVAVAMVLVSPPSQTLSLGQQRVLTAFAMSSSGGFLSLAGRTVTWKSSNPAVVTVSSTGAAAAVGGGKANVVVTVDGMSATSVITVDAPLPAVSLKTSADRTLGVGETVQLTATPVDATGAPAAGSFSITWSSSDATVAKVSAAGVVQALKAGSAKISAKTSGLTGTTSVTVQSTQAPVAVSRSGIAQVILTPSYQQMELGQVRSMGVILLDKNGKIIPLKGRKVTWKISDPSVVEMVGPKAVRGASPGFATVTATVEGISGKAEFAIVRAY